MIGGSSLIHSGAYGGEGRDHVIGGDGWFTTADGGAGNDHVTSGHGKNNTAFGGEGMDIVESSGRGKNVALNGGKGNDVLISRTGNEKLDGGEGFDTLQVSGSSREYALKTNDKGEAVLVRMKVADNGQIECDKNGQPIIVQEIELNGIEAVRFEGNMTGNGGGASFLSAAMMMSALSRGVS